MIRDAGELRRELEALYARPQDEVDLHRFVVHHDVHDDDLLCEMIEVDGRSRIARGQPVMLERYIAAIPDLPHRPDPLDVAISVTFRAATGSGRVDADLLESMVKRYPALEGAIREAAVLSEALISTAELRSQLRRESRPLPSEFGPRLDNGRSRYEMRELLGEGAFGQVYLAVDRYLSEEDHPALVAIKILSNRSDEPWARQRLIEEATKARRIDHRNVVRVVDRGVTDDDEDYIVYEYVDGGDLAAWIDARTLPIPPLDAAQLVANIARGAQAAHFAGVVHCDLKPGNVMMTLDDSPKIADFGIAARLSDDGAHDPARLASTSGNGASFAAEARPLGNLAFIAPEQFRKEPGALSVAADVYAMGGLLYLLTTGRLPNGSSVEAIARTHDLENGRTAPVSIRAVVSIDEDLDRICKRAMAVSANDRYSSAGSFADDLESWLRHEPVRWMRPSPWRIVSLWARRKPALAVAIVLLGLALVGLELTLRNAQNQVNLRQIADQRREIADRERILAEQSSRLTKLELEQEERIKAEARSRIALGLRTILQGLEKGSRVDTEILSGIWLLNQTIGIDMLSSLDSYDAMIAQRHAVFQKEIDTAQSRGEAAHFITLVRQTQLALWLAFDNDFETAAPLIEATRTAWAEVLSDDDSWLVVLDAIAAAIDANRAIHATGDGAGQQSAAEALESMRVGINAKFPGSPVHALVLNRLLRLYEEGRLNDRERYENVLDEMAGHFKSFGS
jgi:serine/threonine protein kinase